MIDGINQSTELVIGLGTALVLVVGLLRWSRPRWRKVKSDALGARDALVGRDAVVDSITGKEITPALPGIGMRMATVEQALITFASNQHDLVELKRWRKDVDKDIEELKSRRVERIVSHAESAAMFVAMDSAIKATPDRESDDD